jgi:hypothetical protein
LKKETTFIIVAILAVFLAVGTFIRLHMQKENFDRVVQEALKTSEGYDQILINTVKRLEDELAMRASFGYQGGKDPMTGKKRSVVLPRKTVEKKGAKEPAKKLDPVKLTAIIFDDEKTKYTAVVMDGERSYSVEVGDKVRDRKITKITEEMIYMEDAENFFAYDIYGKIKKKSKTEEKE